MTYDKKNNKNIAIGTSSNKYLYKNNQIYIDLINYAANKGIKIIDTALNYCDGNAHQNIKNGLLNIEDKNDIHIITKVGQYTQSEFNYYRKKLNDDFFNFHPSYINECVKFINETFVEFKNVSILLHNPEDFLKTSNLSILDLSESFDILENEVKSKRIKSWVSHHGMGYIYIKILLDLLTYVSF